MTARQMLRGLLKFLAVAVGAGALGVGVGVGLAEVGGSGDTTAALETTGSPSATTITTDRSYTPATPTTPTTQSTSTSGAAQTTQTTPTQTAATSATPAPTPHVQVLSALLCPATAASEQADRQARVTVGVRVTNRDSRTLAAQAPRLLVGAARIGSDPGAKAGAGALLKALAPAASATGTLRFQTSGSVTQRLTGQRRARLGIAGRNVAVPIEIGLTPATCG
jgi:pyruvate/2-oxoglutarate dehydrogenase complex dihydrolipoamide acyltransferase (E2) component